jgi:TP901 family phage tail tape measure protein
VAGVEAFTILAILDAKDRISGVIRHVDETLDKFAETSARAAEVSRTAGEAIDESLLQTASGADALEVANARLAASHARLALATEELAGAERQLLDADRLAAQAADGDAIAMSRQSEAAERLAAAQRMVRTVTAEVTAAQSVQAATIDAAAASTATGTTVASRFGGAASTAGTALRTMGKFAMGAGLAAAAVGYESVKAATSFQTLITRLVTSAGESKSNLDIVRQGILNISSSVGVSANEAAKGMYTVESAGYHAADAVTVLRAATEGAAIEGADFATVSNAVTDVLKDYHWGADHATTATSQLITAVSYGKTNFQNMASAMSNVLPLASAYHIKLNDVTGVLAEMTAHGMTAARASFNIANAMRSLANPTGTMTKELQLFGLTAHDMQSSLDNRGLAGTLQWLSTVAHKGAGDVGQTYNEALRKLVGTATGLQVALLTTGENAKDTNKAIKGIGDATGEAGGHVEGFAELQGTMANKMDRAKAAIHNAGIAIGSALLPAVTKIAGKIADILTPLAGWIEKHQKLTTIVLGSLVGLGALAAIIWSITTAVEILLSPVTLVVVAIALLVAGVIYAYKHFATFRNGVNELGVFLKTTFVEAWIATGKIIQWFSDNVMPLIISATKSVFDWFDSHKQNFIDAWNTLVRGVRAAAEWFNDNVIAWIRGLMSDFISWWKDHSVEIREAWKITWDYVKTVFKVTWDILSAVLSVILSTWKTTWGIIWDTIKVVWAAISGAVKLQMHAILNVIAVLLDILTGHWGKAWKDIKKLVSQGLHDVISEIRNVTSGFGTLLYDAGKNVIKGLISGIGTMIGGVGNAIGDVVTEIKDHLPWSPAKKGPLSGAGAPEIGGRNIVKLMAQGISTAAPQLESAMAHLMMTVKAKQSLSGVGGLNASVTGSLAGSLAGSGSGATTVLNFDLRGSQVMSDRDMDQLVNKIGKQIATRILPAGGVRIRM